MDINQEDSELGDAQRLGSVEEGPSCLVGALLTGAMLVFLCVGWSGSFALCRYYAPSWVGSVAGLVLWILSLKVGLLGAAIALFFQVGLDAFSLVWRAARRMVGLDRRARGRVLFETNIWGAAAGFVVAIFALGALTALIFSLVHQGQPEASFVEMMFALGGYHAFISFILVWWHRAVNGREYY